MRIRKTNKINIREDALLSRFVVDLKKDNEIDERAGMEQPHDSLEIKLEKLAELDYKKCFDNGRERVNKTFSNYKSNLAKLKKDACAGMINGLSIFKIKKSEIKYNRRTKKRKLVFKRYERFGILNELAFAGLIKFFWESIKKAVKIMDKICYGIGWAVIFILRLIYLIFKTLILTLAKRFFLKPPRLHYKNALVKLSDLFFKNRGEKSGFSRAAEVKKNNPMAELPFYARGRLALGTAFKPVLIFSAALFILILPLKGVAYYNIVNSAKGRVLGESEIALNNLFSAGQAAKNLNFKQADKGFSLAGANFLAAQTELKEINNLLFSLASFIPNQDIKLASLGKKILMAGEYGAGAGKNLSLAGAELLNYRPNNFNLILSNTRQYGQAALDNLTRLQSILNQISLKALPDSLAERLALLKQKTKELNNGLSRFIGLADGLKIFLGDSKAKRYLLVFQNNSELRASGGFVGSFAIIDIVNGQIKKIEAPGGGSYDTDAGLLIKIKSPEPLRLVRPDWRFWDANWWFDWTLSAKKLAWFYENSGGSSVDGVIGLTPTVVEKLLKIIGPIDLKEKYGVIIDSDNFWRVTQDLAEQKPNVTKQPKKIIGDLMNKIIEEAPKRLSRGNVISLIAAMEESFSDKNILLYFKDQGLQSKAKELGWSGEIKETGGDYLNVINTNIAGGKSDRRIKQKISHLAEIQPNGEIVDTLKIIRTHEGIRREPFSGVRNVDWMRIYAPLGSKLISAQGFKPVDKIFFKEADSGWPNDPDVERALLSERIDEASGTKIYEELNKTVFANWSQVDPGETIEITIKYELPFKLANLKINSPASFLNKILINAESIVNPENNSRHAYSLLAQKQPGMNASTITSELKLSDNFEVVWNLENSLNTGPNGWFKEENFNQDKLMAAIIEEK